MHHSREMTVAKTDFAVELAHFRKLERFAQLSAADIASRRQEQRVLVPPQQRVVHESEKLVGLVDLRARCSSRGIAEKAASCIALFKDANVCNHKLFAEVQRMTGRPVPRASIEQMMVLVDRLLERKFSSQLQQSCVGDMLLRRRRVLLRAHIAWRELRTAVGTIVEARRQLGADFVSRLGGDVIELIARHLAPPAAAALLACSSNFRNDQACQQRLPSPIVRLVDGHFPHATRRERDCAGRVADVHYVVQRSVVRLVVDFATVERRAMPLKRTREGGRLEPGPEDPRARGPESGGDITLATTNWDRRRVLTQQRARHAWLAAEGGQEQPRADVVKMRHAYSGSFEHQPDLRVSLVYADTHDLVQDELRPGALELSNAVRKAGGVFRPPERLRNVPFAYVHGSGGESSYDLLPAQCRLHVPVAHLSAKHGGREFKFLVEVEGEQTRKSGGGALKLKSYTPSFLVVSNWGVRALRSARGQAEGA